MGKWGIYHGNETKKGWSGKGRLLVDGLQESQAKAIADVHNAELAESTDAAVQEMLLLKQQLAAERRKRENSDRKWIVAAGQLRQQLAVESNRANEAEKQLAAALAAIRNIRDEAVTLVDARKRPKSVLHFESPQRIKDKANAALANGAKCTGEPIPCKAGQGFIHWKQRHADKCLICHPQPKPAGEQYEQTNNYNIGFSRNATTLAIKDMVDGLRDKELIGLFHYLEAVYKTRRKKRSFYGVH